MKDLPNDNRHKFILDRAHSSNDASETGFLIETIDERVISYEGIVLCCGK